MDSRIKELFERYQSGKATSEEQRLVDDWFASFDSRQQQEFTKEQYTGLFAQMDEEIAGLTGHKPGRNRVTYMRWLQVAAVLLVGFGAIFYKNFRKPKIAAVNYTLISAPNGIRKELALPDGSVVFLNSGSSLRVLPGFGVKSRLIELTGEAFFIVQHDPERPFVIQSGKLVITDVGTSFDVKAYDGENQIKVSVETGEVNVKEAGPGKAAAFPKSIMPNQQLIYNKDSRLVILTPSKTSEISAWRKNQLRFDNASLVDIAAILERWYGVTVTLNGKKDGRRYTVSFNNEPILNVLKILEKLSGIHYQVNNNSIQINLNPGENMK